MFGIQQCICFGSWLLDPCPAGRLILNALRGRKCGSWIRGVPFSKHPAGQISFHSLSTWFNKAMANYVKALVNEKDVRRWLVSDDKAGARGTYGTQLGLVTRLVGGAAFSFCVAGVALGDIDLHFVWQAWHLRHAAGSGDGLGCV
eukprot:s70_g54.t1